MHSRVDGRYENPEWMHLRDLLGRLRACDHSTSNAGQSLETMLGELNTLLEKIERGEREWQDAFDAVQDPIFLHDERYRILRANLAYARAAGVPVQALIGRSYWDAFPKGTGPLPGCCGLVDHHSDPRHEEVVLDDGRIFLSRGFAVRDVQGHYLYSVHVMEDITEQKRAEQRLQLSESRLKESQAVAHLGSWELDLVRNELWWSDENYRIFGLEPREGNTYRTFLEVVHPEDRERVNLAYSESVLNGSPYDLEHRLLLADGTVKWVHERCVTHYDAQGNPLRSSGTTLDITARRQADQALNRSNRALKAISSCNSVLVHADREDVLLNDMCRVITEDGGYRFSWIGLVEEGPGKRIVPVAHAGYENGYLDLIKATYRNCERGRGPAGQAIRSGRISVVHDTGSDPDFAPWREAAQERGYRSVLALPLKDREGQVFAVLCIYAGEAGAFDDEALALMRELANDVAYGIHALRTRRERDHYLQAHRESDERYKKVLVDTIRAISLTVEKRDPYTAGHQYRVAQLSVAIGREMGLAEERLEGLRLGAMIHDIGKIYVPAEILNRPGRLTKAEFEIIQSHAEVGYDIVKDVQFPWPVADMVIQHHERLDGSGYPRGLCGDEILLEARILAVADVVEAITSHRPYRPAVGFDQALIEIETHRGSRYDPDVVDACLCLLREKGFSFEENGKP